MTRKYSSISVQTTLANGISSSATSMTAATGTGSLLMGGVTLTSGNVDQFTIAIDPDTTNEEIVFITAVSSDTFTIVRGRAGSTAITHSGGAVIKHVLTSNDLDYYTTGVDSAVTPTGTTTLTNKTLTAPVISTIVNSGTITLPTSTDTLVGRATTDTLTNKTLTTPVISTISNTGTITLPTSTDTLVGRATTDTLTNKTLTSPTINSSVTNYPSIKSPREVTTVSATAATGTINFDTVTQGTLYYTTSASANWTLNVRGDGSTTLNSLMATGESITVVFLVTQGATAYYGSALTIDGTSVTPKWQGGTAPSSGSASSIDAYSYTIFKTGSAAYTVFASQVKFA